MKILELLQGFNSQQERQNQAINQRFKQTKCSLDKAFEEIEIKVNTIQAYASYDEINEKMAKLQSNGHHQSSLLESLSKQMA